MFKHVVWLGALVVAGGCGGAEYGAELAKRPEPVVLARVENKTLALPGDQPFSITLKEASEKAGLLGTADADANANGQGTGMARAQVEQGGTAAASFQVGHAFQNTTTRHMQVEVSTRMTLQFSVSDAADDPLPLAGAYATLYARNNQNRTLAKLDLFSHKSDQGDASGSETESLSFEMLLAPGETANVYVAGHVQINAEEQKTAAGEITLEGLEMDIKAVPAPAIGSAEDAG